MRRVALMTIVLLLASVGILPPAEAATDVDRRAGRDRVGTAVEVARAGWQRSEVALLATAYAFPDALAAGSLAAKLEAPLLLTAPDALPEVVADELRRLQVAEVVILGGGAAVSARVAEQVRGLPTRPSVRRVSGADRWETAVRVAREAGAPSGEVVIVSGTNYPDAVSAGALTATGDRPPVLLTQRDALPPATLEGLSALRVERAVVIGGSAAVSGRVVEQLQRRGLQVRRLSGDSRFTTSVEVAKEAMRRLDGPVPVVFATGQNYPDALSAGAFAARVGGPVVLVPANGSGAPLDAFLRSHTQRWRAATIVGGPAAISAAGAERLRRAINDAPPLELSAGMSAIVGWFAALDGRDYAALRARSSGAAGVYADYVSRAAPLGDLGVSRHHIVSEASGARPLGGGRFALNAEVDWTVEGSATVRINAFTVREHPNGAFTVENFLRAGRQLGEYVLDGAAHGVDHGHFAVHDIRWFRRADLPSHDVLLLARITNRRAYPIFIDDLAAGLQTTADGRFYAADDARFPQIPAGGIRDVLLSWEAVSASHGGGWAFFMVYGPDRQHEYEQLVDLVLPRWPR